jgi:hypothetical protein
MRRVITAFVAAICFGWSAMALERSPKAERPIQGDDKAFEAQTGPFMDLLKQVEQERDAGRMPSREEVRRRWNTLEKQHGQFNWDRFFANPPNIEAPGPARPDPTPPMKDWAY